MMTATDWRGAAQQERPLCMRWGGIVLAYFVVKRAAAAAITQAGFLCPGPSCSPSPRLHMKRKAPDASSDEGHDPFKSFRYEGQEGEQLGPVTPVKAEKRRSTPRSGPSSSSESLSTPGSSSPAASPARLTEKYNSPGKPERPLRLLLVGHNPSDHAWTSGHYYSNPSNRMWRLLTSTGIVLPHFTAQNDDDCPHLCGVGFTDLGTGTPGTKSSAFSSQVLRSWRQSLYQRLKAHTARAGAPPKVIAFTGKRQFKELMFDHPDFKKGKGGGMDVSYGLQAMRPLGWPFSKEEVAVFVLTSSSGASALKNEVREAPYRELAGILEGLEPWVVEEGEGSAGAQAGGDSKGP